MTKLTQQSLTKEMTANKVFGTPKVQQAMAMKGKKMTPIQIQKRKRTMISNAATKTFNRNYSQ